MTAKTTVTKPVKKLTSRKKTVKKETNKQNSYNDVITEKEYTRRLNHNIRTFKKQLLTQKFDLTQYHFFEQDKKENDTYHCIRKYSDILGSAIIGCLPSVNRIGADGIKLEDGKFKEIEIKFNTVNISERLDYIKNKNVGNYYTKSGAINIKRVLKDSFVCQFFTTKFIDSYVIAFDSELFQIIDIIYISKESLKKISGSNTVS